MAKTRIHARISDKTWAQLKRVTEAPGVTQSAIIEEALRCYFDPERKAGRDQAILRRLDAIDLRQGAIERDVALCLETLGQYVLYWLSRTEPLPDGERDIAYNLGRKRFDYFIEQVALKLGSKTSLSKRLLDGGIDEAASPNED
jgi:hypothetical protein